MLYLGNPASNKNNVYYKLYYGETKILDDGLAPFTYATLECTNCKLKEGTYKFKLEIIFENGKLFTSNSKTSQEISLEIVSKEKFKELRKALAH